MHRNQQLYEHLLHIAPTFTEQWYANIEDNHPNSVYASKNKEIVRQLKEKNQDFFQHVIKIFIEPEEYLYSEYSQWSRDLANDTRYLQTPLPNVVREYISSQEIILRAVKDFISMEKDNLSLKQILSWHDLVTKATHIAIHNFIEAYDRNTLHVMESQKQMIAELSSPIIVLENNVAMLPIVGDIDTNRAKVIQDLTLKQCAEKDILHLCIDLSGVVMIDTMVAHQLFNLIKSLKLIGISSTISGIRPEIAQTAIHLGLDFNDVNTAASLAQALKSMQGIS